MNLHPGDAVRWQGESHTVVAIHSAYVTLRPLDGDDDIEVLSSDFAVRAEAAAPRPIRPLLDLRSVQSLDGRDRKVVDVWLEELARLDQLLSTGMKVDAAHQQTIDSVNRRLGTEYSPKKVSRQRRALDDFGVSGRLDRRRFGLPDMSSRSYDERLINDVLAVQAGQRKKSTGTATRAIWLIRRELDECYGEGTVPMPSQRCCARTPRSSASPACSRCRARSLRSWT